MQCCWNVARIFGVTFFVCWSGVRSCLKYVELCCILNVLLVESWLMVGGNNLICRPSRDISAAILRDLRDFECVAAF